MPRNKRGAWKRQNQSHGRNVGRNSDNQDQKGQDWHRYGYKEIIKENEAFVHYYKTQGIVPESDWEEFMESLRAPLSSTFRITGFRSQAKQLLKMMKLEESFTDMVGTEINGRLIQPPTCLPWYPDELAWKIDLPRSMIKRKEALKTLQKFLVAETESGNISRQEAVSMIPPLLLNIKHHHKILDMCAAPGSKTSQLIEYLHAEEGQIPEGFVIGNDADNKRCYLMVHQVKRIQSPNFMIINHDASKLPSMRITPPDAAERKTLYFDRVLADVPCSGDGTMRKNPDIWNKWSAGNGLNLHGLQIRILRRGVELLEIGGRLVYSTCSMNPVEDEAVIATILQKSEGSLELIDAACELPELKYKPGVKKWKVMSRKKEWFEKWEEVPENLRTIVRPSMFPPAEDISDSLHLERCMRILPHMQDTGGFFIAVFKKISQVPWLLNLWKKNPSEASEINCSKDSDPKETNDENDLPSQTCASDDSEKETVQEGLPSAAAEETEESHEGKAEVLSNRPPLKKRKLQGYKEDPFIFLKEDDASWPQIKEFYGIKDKFPQTQLMVRCETGRKRNIYFLCPQLKNILLCNEERIKFINMGVKVLTRSPSPIVLCDFRLAQEGVNVIHPYLELRKVQITSEDMITLLTMENPFFSRISAESQKAINSLGPGSVLYYYLPSSQPGSHESEIVIAGWIGKTSCRSFVPKFERHHILSMLGVQGDIIMQPMERDIKKDKEDINKEEMKAHSDNEKLVKQVSVQDNAQETVTEDETN